MEPSSTDRRKPAPTPVKLAASDHRLREHPDFLDLRQQLTSHGTITAPEIWRLLGAQAPEEGMSLVQFLIKFKLLTQAELQTAKDQKRGKNELPLWKVLQELEYLGDETLALATAALNHFPYWVVEPARIDPAVVRHLDGRTAQRWQAFPVAFAGEEIILAVVDPREFDLEEGATFMGRPLRLATGARRAIFAAIDHWYGEEGKQAASLLRELDIRGVETREENGTAPPLTTAPDAVVKLVNQIIMTAVKREASDIHVIPDDRFVLVYYRIDGQLHLQHKLPLSQRNQLISRIKIVAGMDIAERRLPQDGNIRVRLPDRTMDIRVSCIPAVRGETLVLRLLDIQVGLVQLEQLGFFPEHLQLLQRSVGLPYGMILLTGPTGSGKSTTLRAALDYISKSRNLHILTVEDPVEVKLERVTQVQVNSRIDFDFARALRHLLRHDPDVIMVGEIRDGETARIAVQAALTGHLVLSTLHTNDAAGAATRLIDIGVEPFLVSSALTLVIAQRLVRLLCRECKEAYPPEVAELHTITALGHRGEVTRLHRPRSGGCPACNGTGFKGRTVIYEMLDLDEEIKGMIARQESASLIRQTARRKKFKPLIFTGLRKVLDGETALGEVATYLDTME